MILREKCSHLVLKTPLAVMCLLRLDVSHQLPNVSGTDGKQPVSSLPGESRHTLLLHPDRRSRFDLRHDFRGRSRRRQTQCEMDVIGHTSSAKTFAIHLSGSTRKIGIQRIRKLVRDKRLTIFGAENNVHKIETQGLRHARDYMSGFQPSTDVPIGDLGLRPRLVCRRTFGPHIATPLEIAGLDRNLTPRPLHPSALTHVTPVTQGFALGWYRTGLRP